MKTFTDFHFQMKTEIVFGRGGEARTGALIRKYGGTKVLLVYGGGSIKDNGLYDRVVQSLKEAGLPFAELGGVKANPRRSFVEEGIRLARAEHTDFYLAVGGGSTIDTTKAIALASANDWEYWKFWKGTKPEKMAPIGTIHTIAAAGSETSRSSVLVDDTDTGLKKGFMWDVARPSFAIMNPELTYSLPAHQTAAGSADIFAHTYMRYFTDGASFLGDQYAIGTMKTVVKYAPIAIASPTDYEARAELMLAGSFSHNDLTGIGRAGLNKGGEHALEHQLSGYYDTAHGAGLSVIMPALLGYFVKHGDTSQVARVAQFAVDVFNVNPEMESIENTARAGIGCLRAWLSSIGLPVTLKALGVPREDLPAAIARCVADTGGQIPGYMRLDEVAIDEIYRAAYA